MCSVSLYMLAHTVFIVLQPLWTAGRLAMTGFFAEVVGELFTGKVLNVSCSCCMRLGFSSMLPRWSHLLLW